MRGPRRGLLILGIGNVLLRDDGVGVHAVRRLERMVELGEVELPPGVTLADGGTLGLDLLPLLEEAAALVLIDAAELGLSPGAVEVIHGRGLGRGDAGRGRDPVGIDELLVAARLTGTLPGAVTVVGVQPAEIAPGVELSGIVRSALPGLVRTVLAEAHVMDWNDGMPGAAA